MVDRPRPPQRTRHGTPLTGSWVRTIRGARTGDCPVTLIPLAGRLQYQGRYLGYGKANSFYVYALTVAALDDGELGCEPRAMSFELCAVGWGADDFKLQIGDLTAVICNRQSPF